MKYTVNVAIALIIGFPCVSLAADSDYKYCSLAGYFGVNSFLGDIASQIANQRGLIGSTLCKAAWSQGYEVSQKVMHGQAGGWTKEETQLIFEASAYSTKVSNFIIKGVGL